MATETYSLKTVANVAIANGYGPGAQFLPEVVALANGGFLVSYVSDDVSEGRGTVHWDVYNAKGIKQGNSDYPASSTNTGDAPDMVRLPDGKILLGWSQDKVYLATLPANGSAGPYAPVSLSTGATGQAIVANEGSYYWTHRVFWATPDGLIMRQYQESGAHSANLLDVNSSVSDVNAATMTASRSAVVYRADAANAIFALVIDYQGEEDIAFHDGEPAFVGYGDQAVVTRHGNDFVVAFREDYREDGTDGISLIKFPYDWDGSYSDLDTIQLTNGGETDPELLTLPDGTIAISYTGTFDNGAYIESDIRLQFLSEADLSPIVFNGATSVSLDSSNLYGDGKGHSSLAAMLDGRFVAAWEDGIDGGDSGSIGAAMRELVRTLQGDDSSETLVGSGISERIDGKGGNDTIDASRGRDTIDGGTQTDTLDYHSSDFSQTGSLDVTMNATGWSTVRVNGVLKDEFRNIEIFGGSIGDDIIRGSSKADSIDGGWGFDTITGGGGKDTLDGGDDFIGLEIDIVSYAERSAAIEVQLNRKSFVAAFVGGVKEDSIRGFEGVRGGSGNDTIGGDGVTNELRGNAGNDRLKGGGDKDTIDGGSGIDTADYSDKTGKVTLTLNRGTNANQRLDGVDEDTVKNIENVIGGSNDDRFTGDTADNVLQGRGGRDTLDGKSGRDTASFAEKTKGIVVALSAGDSVNVKVNGVNEDKIANIENVVGGSGADEITGDTLANRLTGNGGSDTLRGGANNDTLRGGAGKDTLDGGGGGGDFADYSDKSTKVEVKLDGSSSVTVKINGAVEDSIKNFEHVTGGKAGDKLTGDSKANKLAGEAGNDTLSGGSGQDTLIGGSGKDTLTGGSAADRFQFTVKPSSTNIDTITDFRRGEDKIALEQDIFAALGSGVTSAEFVAKTSGHSATNTSQHLIYDRSKGTLWFDIDGNKSGGVEAVQIAQLGTQASHPSTLGIDDFRIV